MAISTEQHQERRTLTVGEAARIAGIGRSSAYNEARRGTLLGVPLLRCGRRVVVPKARFLAVLDGIEPNGSA